MKTMNRMIVSAAATFAVLSAGPAAAVPLLDVGGTRTDFTPIAIGESAGLAFTLDETFTDVVITPDVFCLGCAGRFVLMQDNVGPTAALSDLVTAELFPGGQADPLSPIAQLDAATYFLILIIDSGSGGWIGGSSAEVTEAAGVSSGISLFADAANTDSTFPGQTGFSALFGFDHYVSITGMAAGTVLPVAEPGSSWLLLAGCIGLLLARRIRRSA